jgi:predicted outer membrane repeat protein
MRLRLECLEGREVPATFPVTTTQDVVDPADGRVSLREAVTKANNHVGVDTIVLPAGVFTINPAAFEDGNLMGDFDITDSVTVRGAGAARTVIDGQQHDRLFDIRGVPPNSMQVVLQGLTVRNGFVIGDGGGIRVGNADLLVRDCVVSGNRASQTGGGISNAAAPGTGNVTLIRTTVDLNSSASNGGGISVTGSSTLTLKNSTVRRNTAGGTGGGIQASTATVTNSIVGGNTAKSVGGGIAAITATVANSTVSGNSAGPSEGGGISATSTANVTNSTVSGNTAGTIGGGIRAATANVTNSTVNDNTAGNSGGGIHSGTATVTNSTVSGNFALASGGISATTANVTGSTVSGNNAKTGGGGISATTANVANSTVSGNTAGDRGGGITATTATLVNVTVTENIANRGGGLFHDPGGVFSLRNTIVAQNLVDFSGTARDVFGDFASQGHNLIGDPFGSTGFGVNGDLVGTAENPLDPGLGPLANNGGPTRTHALLAGSPAIDHGDNSVSGTDQRGRPRIKDGDGRGGRAVDIGAVER